MTCDDVVGQNYVIETLKIDGKLKQIDLSSYKNENIKIYLVS